MIKIEDLCYNSTSFLMAIQGMRNPMNSWDKSDSGWDNGWPSDHGILIDSDSDSYYECRIGPNDQELMLKLAKAGSVHAKYRRFIVVYMDITAPLYWWKEFETYRTGVAPIPTDIEINSCSTMHKIQAKEFELDDFSHEHLYSEDLEHLEETIKFLNASRDLYIDGGQKNKRDWWQMIQLLPSSYNQKRTVMLNYEVLAHMYHDRKEHKLDEWRIFCETMKDQLPFSEIFTLEEN